MVDTKSRLKQFLVSNRVLELAQRLKSARTLILRYHSVQDNPDKHAFSIGRGIIHSTEAFTQQMEWIARRYEPTTLDEVEGQRADKGRLPRRGVIITFDDGYADNFTIAAPILNRLGLRAAFYITVDCIEPHKMPWFCRLRHAFAVTGRESWTDSAGRSWNLGDAGQRHRAFLTASASCAVLAGDAQEERIAGLERDLAVNSLAPSERLMLSWDQIRELHRQGHIVGSHTLTHPNLAQVPRDVLAREMGESKARLEEQLGTAVHHFSYPSPILEPHWTPETVACGAAVGYRTAVTCTPGAVVRGASLPHLPRIFAPEKLADFQWAVQCAFLGRFV